MSLPAPKNADQYLTRFNANQDVYGYGLETGISMPCPFCAAPGFLNYRIIEVEDAMRQGATCGECGRSAKAIFTRTPTDPPAVSFEIVQTGGDDPPEWLTPKMRRVEA